MIKAVTIIRKIERLRKAIRREGTPAVQEAWDEMEPHVSIFLGGAQGGTGRTDEDDGRGAGHLG